jgi:hypothetical protein
MGFHLAMNKVSKKGIQIGKKLIDCLSNVNLWQSWPDGLQVPTGLSFRFADQASVSKGLRQNVLHTVSADGIQQR